MPDPTDHRIRAQNKLHQTIEQRQQITDCLLMCKDGQLPVAQHLHGSINDQYQGASA